MGGIIKNGNDVPNHDHHNYLYSFQPKNHILLFTTPNLIILLFLTCTLTFIIGCLSYVKVLTLNKSNSLLLTNRSSLVIAILWNNYLFHCKNNVHLRLLNPTKNN